ncbi:MAG TPA: hypothetical protein VGR53_09935 [Nitrososphaerales archaeon]|nr:hypothetical protein [Nitrososphaerales archaeon]
MKRPIVFILIFILLVSLLSVPLLLLHLGLHPVSKVQRQVDPAAAPAEIVYGPDLFVFYGLVITSIDAGNLSRVEALLGQTGFLHIPSEILGAVNTFNGLLNSTANILAAAHTEILDANTSLSSGRIDQATLHVQTATTDLRKANGTITELVAASPRLASLTGIPPDLLVQKVHTIEDLYSKYISQVRLLQSQITKETMLVQTSVTLTVTPSSVETGSRVHASGTLTTSAGSPLVSRSVTIYLSGASLGNAVTDTSGHFNSSFPTPYVYQPTVSLFASYLPTGNDLELYAPSSSSTIQLNISFESPVARVSIPSSVYAGMSISLNGTLTANSVPLSGYEMTLVAFGIDLSSKSSNAGGFAFNATAPANLNAGTYSLSLQTSGNGTVGPLSLSFPLKVIKLDPSVTMHVPVFVVAGFGATVSGAAEDNGSELQGATVLNISPSPSINTSTSESGSFSFNVTPSLTSSNGALDYTIGVYPKESWISPTRVNVSVFVINPLTLVLPALSAGLLVMVVRRRQGAKQAPTMAVKSWEAYQPVIPVPAEARGLAKTYFAALELVEESTSVLPSPQQTLREYLGEVRGGLKGSDHFEYITLAFETMLYGPGVAPQMEERAQEEFELLRGALAS